MKTLLVTLALLLVPAGAALALALQPNGRILVAGWTTVNDNAAVFRLKGV